jgi:hypothetical protein
LLRGARPLDQRLHEDPAVANRFIASHRYLERCRPISSRCTCHGCAAGTSGRRACEAAEALAREGVSIRYIRTMFLQDDETCFHLFEAPGPAAVEEVSRRAALGCARIVGAIEASGVSAEGTMSARRWPPGAAMTRHRSTAVARADQALLVQPLAKRTRRDKMLRDHRSECCPRGQNPCASGREGRTAAERSPFLRPAPQVAGITSYDRRRAAISVSPKSSEGLLIASILQAPGFRSDVTVFRLNATALGPIWLGACVSAEYGGTRLQLWRGS